MEKLKKFLRSESRVSLYLSGVALGLIIGGWYRKQVGPINSWAVATGAILVLAAVLHERGKK